MVYLWYNSRSSTTTGEKIVPKTKPPAPSDRIQTLTEAAAEMTLDDARAEALELRARRREANAGTAPLQLVLDDEEEEAALLIPVNYTAMEPAGVVFNVGFALVNIEHGTDEDLDAEEESDGVIQRLRDGLDQSVRDERAERDLETAELRERFAILERIRPKASSSRSDAEWRAQRAAAVDRAFNEAEHDLKRGSD